jgi:hypothetical protein
LVEHLAAAAAGLVVILAVIPYTRPHMVARPVLSTTAAVGARARVLLGGGALRTRPVMESRIGAEEMEVVDKGTGVY